MTDHQNKEQMSYERLSPQELFNLVMELNDAKHESVMDLLTILTDKYPGEFGVAHLELARLHRAEGNLELAVHHYVWADWKGCGLALSELKEVRNLPEYHPPPIDKTFEEECIENARANMRPEHFLDAERFLHKAILAGSTEALSRLKQMRKKMFEENLEY